MPVGFKPGAPTRSEWVLGIQGTPGPGAQARYLMYLLRVVWVGPLPGDLEARARGAEAILLV